jgi:hypothetical protein
MTPKTRNRILGVSVIVAILVWQVWLGYEVVTPPEIPIPDPQTIVVEPAPVQVELGDPALAFDASNTTHLTNLDVAGSVTYGTSDLYPLGYDTDGYQLVYGSDDVTGNKAVGHGLTTVTWAVCSLAEDPTSGAGDGAYCTVLAASNVVTVTVWQDDFVTEATEEDVAVNWLVVGQP